MSYVKELQTRVSQMEQQTFKANLTVAFSAYNILEYLKLAIGSFLYLYPELRNNIVVFDDGSTDGTREWLLDNNIRRITWTPKYEQRVKEHYTQHKDLSLIYRVNVMINDVMDQTETQYLLLNDGDVVFTEPFLETYEALIRSEYKALVVLGGHGDELFKDPRYAAYAEIFQDYKKLYMPGRNGLWRIHQFHALFDLQYLKSRGILFDRVFDKNVEAINSLSPPIADSGLDLRHQYLVNEVPYYDLCYPDYIFRAPVYHFGWKASEARLKTQQHQLNEPHLERMRSRVIQDLEENQQLRQMIEQVNPKVLEMIYRA